LPTERGRLRRSTRRREILSILYAHRQARRRLDRRNASSCTLLFGNFGGPDFDNFGGDAQYGTPNLSWFFGQNTSGPVANPCIPRAEK